MQNGRIRYPREHKGYRCLDLDTRRVIMSRHVVFDEATFPYVSPEHSLPGAENPTPTDPIFSGIRIPATSYHPGAPPPSPTKPHLTKTPPAPRTTASAPRTTMTAQPHTPPLLSAQPHTPPSLSAQLHTPPSLSAQPHTPTSSSIASYMSAPVSPDNAASTSPDLPCLPPHSISIQPTNNSHRMITRGKAGYFMPKHHFSLTFVTSAISPSLPIIALRLRT
jgi:hypothetical protein